MHRPRTKKLAPGSSSTNPLLTSSPQQAQNASSPLEKDKAIDSDAEIMAAHSIVADQQRRIRQLEKDLCESQAEIQRLRAANLDMERRQPKKVASIKNVEAASKATPLGPSPSSISAIASSSLATSAATALGSATAAAVAGASSAPILSLTASHTPPAPSNSAFQTSASPPSHVPAETHKASEPMAMAITSTASPASKCGTAAGTLSAKKQQSDEVYGFGNTTNTASNNNHAIANSANTSTKNTTPGTKAAGAAATATVANASTYSIASPFEFDNEKGDQKSSRYWTPEEHDRFLDGLKIYGSKDIKNIAKHVGTRNATQVRTHAQKYYLRLSREAMRAQVPMESGESPSESPSIPMHTQSSPLMSGGGDLGLSVDDATTLTPALNSQVAVQQHTVFSSKDAEGGQPKSSPKRGGGGAALSRRKSDVASALVIAKMDTSTDMVSMGSGSAGSGPMIGNLSLNPPSGYHLSMVDEDGAYRTTSLGAAASTETLPAYAVMTQQQQLQAGFVQGLSQEQQTRSRASKPGKLKAARQDSVSPGFMAAAVEEQGSKKKQTKGLPDTKMVHVSYATARSPPVMTSATGKRTRSKKVAQKQPQHSLNAYDADIMPEIHAGHSPGMELASASSMPVSLSQEMANAALDDDMVMVTGDDQHHGHGHDHDHHMHPHQELHSGFTPSKDLLEAHSLQHHHQHSSGAGQGVSLDPDHEHHHGFGIGLDDAFDHDHDHDPSSVIVDLEDSGRLFGDDHDAGEHDEHLRPRHGDTLDVPGSEGLYHHVLHSETHGESMQSGSSDGMESSVVVEHPRAVILENRHSFGSLAVLSEELDDS